MPDSTDNLMVQLGTHVSDLKALRESGNNVAARGSTLEIFGAIGKLREIGEPGIAKAITKTLAEARIDFDPSSTAATSAGTAIGRKAPGGSWMPAPKRRARNVVG